MKILDVGQCGFDGPRLARLWREVLSAEVDSVDTGDDALARLSSRAYNLVLVNRVLAADGSSGLDVIERLLTTGQKTPVMLVSDLPDAQDLAVALGAVRGFGKAHLGDQATLQLVSRVAGGDASTKGKSRSKR